MERQTTLVFCHEKPMNSIKRQKDDTKGQLLITPERMKSFEPKWQNDLGSFPRQTIQHYINSSLCPKHWCQRSLSWPVLWKHTRPPRTNTFFFLNVLFIIGDWNVKAESPELPGVAIKFGLGVQNEVREKGNRVLAKEHTGNSKCPLSETQEMILHMDITR